MTFLKRELVKQIFLNVLFLFFLHAHKHEYFFTGRRFARHLLWEGEGDIILSFTLNLTVIQK